MSYTRICAKCGIAKEHSQFYRNIREKFGIGYRCKKCSSEYTKEMNRHNRDKRREQKLKHRHGITLKEYNSMVSSQGKKCAICGEQYKFSFHVDHDHKTGKIRGLLCNNCNRGLGHFKDNINVLTNAIQYLNLFTSI